MVGWPKRHSAGPIGIDIGSRTIKMVQLSFDRLQIREAVCWDIPASAANEPAFRTRQIVDIINKSREGRDFRGRNAVFCLSTSDLFVQNIRVPQTASDQLRPIVEKEAASRIPFDAAGTEIQYFEADTIRQGDALRREVIVLACKRSAIASVLELAEASALNPIAIDAAPAALLRCYTAQFRRSSDEDLTAMFVNIGASCTTVVIARGDSPRFIKQLGFGSRQLDDAVAQDLHMRLADASALRRHHGDRRADRRDPEITKSVAKAVRPALEAFAGDLAMCMRYYSVTFRGQPISRAIVGGGEASATLIEWLAPHIDIACELADPSRPFKDFTLPGRPSQWDIALGLALREE